MIRDRFRRSRRVAQMFVLVSIMTMTTMTCADLITTDEQHEATPERIGIPTAEPLVGTAPIGRSARYYVFNVEALATSNTGKQAGWYPARATPEGWEFRPDGYGYTLRAHTVQDASQFRYVYYIGAYRDYAWTWYNESRWVLDGSRLLVVTTQNTYYELTFYEGNNDAIGYSTHLDEWWFRIGSPIHLRVVEFQKCVDANEGRKLFEVVKCDSPFRTGES